MSRRKPQEQPLQEWHDSQLSYARKKFSATRLGWAIRSISFLTLRVVTGKLSNGSLKTKEHHQNHQFTDFLTGPGPEWANIAAQRMMAWPSFLLYFHFSGSTPIDRVRASTKARPILFFWSEG